MKDYRITDMVTFVFGYGLLSIVFFFFTTTFLSVWLGINAGLAIVPLVLITWVYKRIQEKQNKVDWISIVLLVLFVFFFPNSFYVVTDLIHLSKVEFYLVEQYTTSYIDNLEGYILLFHIVLTLFIGILAGIRSVLTLEEVLKVFKMGSKERFSVISILFVLSSIGIYIGRFLRFFSWDILRPFTLLKEVFVSLDFFAILFIALFTLIHYTLYYGYRLLFEDEPF
jgi:uncharacterized membrane protein